MNIVQYNNNANFDEDLENILEEKLCFLDSGNASLESRKKYYKAFRLLNQNY